jgi:hypothetical protein
MATIDPTNTVLLAEAERAHESALRDILSNVFEADQDLADWYLRALADAAPEERLLALHDDPMDIATMLTGFSVNQEQLVAYNEMVRTFEREASQKKFATTERPVSLSTLDMALSRLGYKRIQNEIGRPYHSWRQINPDDRSIAYLLTLSAPQFRAEGFPEAVYDLNEVIDFLAGINFKWSESRTGNGMRILDFLTQRVAGASSDHER